MMQVHRVNQLPVTVTPDDIYLVKDGIGAKLKVASKDAQPTVVSFKKMVTLSGPTTLPANTTGTYTITNYDATETYTVSSTDGTVDRQGNTITFIVTNAALESASFTVNGRVLTVTILTPTPVQATVVSPLQDSRPSYAPLPIYSSAFAMNTESPGITHASSDWELSTDPNFGTIIESSYADSVNKTSWVLSVAVSAPVIQFPTGIGLVSFKSLTISASPFSINWTAGGDTHQSTDWEISTDPNFTTIVASSYNDTTNKTTWTTT